jgi:hypothetical protein
MGGLWAAFFVQLKRCLFYHGEHGGNRDWGKRAAPVKAVKAFNAMDAKFSEHEHGFFKSVIFYH